MADYILNYVFISAESVFRGLSARKWEYFGHRRDTEEMLVPVESGFPRSDTDTVGVCGDIHSKTEILNNCHKY